MLFRWHQEKQQSIWIVFWYDRIRLFYLQYRDKNQEVREALEFDPEDDSEQSEVEEYRVHHKKHHKSEGKKKDDDFSISGYKQTHSVPRGPRLLLDDALIMVIEIIYLIIDQLANLALPAKEPTEIKEEKVEEKSDHSDEGIIKSKKEIAKSTVESNEYLKTSYIQQKKRHYLKHYQDPKQRYLKNP